MPVDKLTIQQFAQKIKTKYPEYKDVDDSLLTNKIITKYPEYKDMVHFEAPKTNDPNATLKLSDFKSETQTQQPNLDFNALKVKAQKIQPSTEETRDAADVTERMNEQVTKRNTAIENTLERKYKNLGTNVKKNSPQYKKDYNDLLQKQMNGDVVISEARDGKPFVIRGAGFLESAGKTLVESFKTPIEAAKTINLEGKALADYLDKKQAETPYLEESAPSGFGGAFGEAAGGFPKIGGLMAINYAVPYLGTAAATAEAELSSSWAHTQDLYQRNLQALTDSGVPFEQARIQAANKAKQDAPIAALPDAVMTAALGEMGANTGAMAKSANNFKTTLLKSGKSIGTFGALGGTAEAARSGIEKAQGYDVNMQQVLDNFGKGAFQWATMDAMFKIAPVISSMPRAAQAAWKDYMSNVPKEVRQTLGEEANKEINGYEEAKKEVPSYYSDEHKTVLADLVQQKNNLEEQKTNHPSFKDDFDEQIATIDGTINAVKHSKDPSSIHVDELTGETHGNHKEFDKLTSQEKNGVVVPKEYGAAETEQVGKDEEKRFKPVAHATDKQGALEIKKPIEIESDKTYTDKSKAQEAADRALSQHYYENGLPDNQKPQKSERAHTTTEENKQKGTEVIHEETNAGTQPSNEPVSAEEGGIAKGEVDKVKQGTEASKADRGVEDIWKQTRDESFNTNEDKDAGDGLRTHEEMTNEFLKGYKNGKSGLSIEGDSVVYRNNEGKVVGFAHFDKKGIREIGVDKGERGKGISSKMIEYLKQEKGIDKVLPPFSKEGNIVSHRNEVKKAIEQGKYEDAISKGEMTRERVNEIIKSAGLETPKQTLLENTQKNKQGTEEGKVVPNEIAELYGKRENARFVMNALQKQMGGRELTGKSKAEYDKVANEYHEADRKINKYEESLNKQPEKIEQKEHKQQELEGKFKEGETVNYFDDLFNETKPVKVIGERGRNGDEIRYEVQFENGQYAEVWDKTLQKETPKPTLLEDNNIVGDEKITNNAKEEPQVQAVQSVANETGSAKIENSTSIESENTEVPPQDGSIGIQHAKTEELRSELGLKEYERNNATNAELEAQAEASIKKGYDIDKLIEKVEGGNAPTGEENIIAKKYLASLKAEFDKTKSDGTLKQIERITDAWDKIGSLQSEAFRTRQGFEGIDDSLAGFFIAKKKANNVDVLTDAQKEEVEQQFSEYKKRTEESEAKAAEYEAKYNDLLAQKEIEKIRKSTVKTKKTHDDFAKERQSLKHDLAAAKAKHVQWLKDNNIQQMGASPFVLTTDMAKVIGKMVKSYVEEGVQTLAEITKKVYDEVKDLLPEITDKHIRDVMAGVYTEKKQTKSELAATLMELRQEAKLLNEYEALLNGEPKKESAKIKRESRLKELRDRIKSIKVEPKDHDLNKLEQTKKRIEAGTKNIQEKLAKGEFEQAKPVPFLENRELQKKYPKLYNETLDALTKKSDARHEFDIALMKDQLAKRSVPRKTFDLGAALIATGKAIVSGIDDSALMIQNIVALTAHPKSAVKAIPEHILDAISEKRFNRKLTALHNSKAWELIKESGLDVTEPTSLKAQEKEEIFDNNLLNKTFVIKGKHYKISKYLTAPFERAFTSLGNNFRVDAFLRLAQRLQDEGYTFQSHPKMFKDLAKVLNTETGRGKAHIQVERATKLVTAGIWSPKLMASRFNILGIGDVFNAATGKRGYYVSLDPKIRAMAIGDTAKFIGAGLSVMGLAAAAGAEIDLDPLSVTFGSIKVGTKRYNVWGGFSQYVRLIAQMSTGKYHNQSGAHEKNRLSIAGRFLRGKLTPAAGVATDVVAQENYFGAPIDYSEEFANLISPLAVKDIASQLKRDGVYSLFTSGIPSFGGLNVSDERDYSKPAGSNGTSSRQASHGASHGSAAHK